MQKTRLLKTILVINLLFISLVNNAQTPFISIVEDVMEEISVNNYEDEYIDWSNVLQELSEQIEHPLNLNTATRQQLERFPFLSPLQVENTLAYIYIHGQMQTVSELMLVEAMDYETIRYLTPFVCAIPVESSKKIELKELLKTSQTELITQLTIPLYKRKGYKDKYLGPPISHSLKYSFRCADKLYIGLVGAQDAGEPFGALHNKKGYDYYSIYLLIQNFGLLKTLAVGNYQMSFGQGLVLNSGFMMGKSAFLHSTLNKWQGIRKHSSTDEYNYFRGIATTLDLGKRWQLSAFYSHRLLDGVVNEAGEITSIYKSGLHRSESENAKRKAATMQLVGGNINKYFNYLNIGATGVYYVMNRSYQPPTNGYRKYNINGSKFYNIGVDYAWRYRNIFATGEAATGTSGWATVNQLHYEFSSDYRVALVHRYYAHDYWAMYARSFGEGSAVQNENGWYIATQLSPLKCINLYASLDLFSFPWWRYRISKPSQGVDGAIRAVYNPRLPVNIEVSYRFKKRERDVTGTQGENILPTYQHRLRLRLNYLANELFSFRTVVDYNRFAMQRASQGFQFTQMMSYNYRWLKLQLQATYFDTDDYDSHVYVSERSMLYSFYTPSFQGKGFRWSAYARYDINPNWMLMAKFGQTIYRNRFTIGSGSDLINSNRKSDVDVLLRMKF